MAVSTVSICNNALAKLGAKQITSLSDDSQEARLCSLFYDQVKNDLLSSHPWNFAIKREILSQLATTPDFEFSYEYQLPSDCLRILRVYNNSYPFRIEGRKLLTDSSTVNAIYISEVSDPTQFPPFFAEILSTRLAVEMAYSLTGDLNMVQLMIRTYDMKYSQAKTYDAQEGTPLTLEANDWIDSRR